MQVPAQVHKFLFIGNAGQSQFLRPYTKPLTGNAPAFHVIIADPQMFAEIRLRIPQTVLRLHRQHGGKLIHQTANLALWVTQDEHESVVMIIKVKYWTLFSLYPQGADVTTKTPEKNQTTDK